MNSIYTAAHEKEREERTVQSLAQDSDQTPRTVPQANQGRRHLSLPAKKYSPLELAVIWGATKTQSDQNTNQPKTHSNWNAFKDQFQII